MLDNIFRGLFDSSTQSVIPLSDFLICIGTALLIGLFLAAVYKYKNTCTGSFLITLSILPAAICVVIMMVNGNIGAGVAVAGAFSLVRFRSAPGTAKEIGTIFVAMCSGLITGMGYIAYAVTFSLILGLITLLYQKLSYGRLKNEREKTLKIVIPEDLDYSDVFDDVIKKYTSRCDTVSVKTTNMGSLFKLTYDITLKDPSKEKEFIDELRCRNGNLEISISRQESNNNEL
ncbi:MAG: DUF4956 domain-containing protein [Acutalibacteraceae bacterium]